MKKKIIAVTLTLAILGMFASPGALAQGNSPAGITIPVTGTFTDALGGTGHFVGSLNLRRFAQANNQIVAVGTLTGTLTNSAGTVLGSIVQTVSLILNAAATQASCQILHLELGPLDLNLLGLVVHLDRVVLDITAVPGPGNLLGNLLCAIANLLNNGGTLQQIISLLNQIIAVL